MITLHLKQSTNQTECEVVIFGNTIVIDVFSYTYEELDGDLANRYSPTDIAKIKDAFKLNEQKFPNESNGLVGKLAVFSLPQLIAIALGTKNKEVMIKLAKYKELLPRCTLARRADLDEDLQLILARDKEQNVLGSLALNKSLTFNAFNAFIKKADLTTKRLLALSLATNEKILEILAKDKDVEVRRIVYQRKGLSQYLSEYLAEEFGDKVTA